MCAGTHDEIVHASHSAALHKLCPVHLARPAHFVEGAGHNDVAEVDLEAFVRGLGEFLRSL